MAAGILSGRIGFQGEGATSELWDEMAQDFVETSSPDGLTAPFAFDLGSMTGVVQIRPPRIRTNSVVGALEKLLSEPGQRWRIESLQSKKSLQAWKASVERITSIRMRVRIPNPHWHGAEDLRELMDQTAAQVVTLEMQSDEGVDDSAQFIQQTEHHIERGYGDARYVGVRTDSSGQHESAYSTALSGEELFDELAIDATGEVPPEDLSALLDHNRATEQTGRHDNESAGDAD